MNGEGTYLDQFREETAVICGSFQSAGRRNDGEVRSAYLDIARTLSLSFPCVAMLAWALGCQDGGTVDMFSVAHRIGYTGEAVDASIDELERRQYMARIGYGDCTFDVTPETVERVVNHYCFGRLMNDRKTD